MLAAGGVYGVIAYSVAQRTREIGVRSALGATRRQILALVLGDGIRVVAAGVGAGVLASLWLARGLTGLLHQVSPADPLALAAVAVLLSLVGLLAAFVPARRATRVSALDALREV
jgi:ABC-type antimicrobial peptide transport system permease subunit